MARAFGFPFTHSRSVCTWPLSCLLGHPRWWVEAAGGCLGDPESHWAETLDTGLLRAGKGPQALCAPAALSLWEVALKAFLVIPSLLHALLAHITGFFLSWGGYFSRKLSPGPPAWASSLSPYSASSHHGLLCLLYL